MTNHVDTVSSTAFGRRHGMLLKNGEKIR